MDYRVTCVRRDGPDADSRIDRLGGPAFNDTIDNVIAAIDVGHTFYVMDGIRRADVYVRTHSTSGRRYLTTDPDGWRENNLLSLPECH